MLPRSLWPQCSNDEVGWQGLATDDNGAWPELLRQHRTQHLPQHPAPDPTLLLGCKSLASGSAPPQLTPPRSGFNLELPDVGPTGSPNPIPTSGLREVLHRADSITDVGPSSSDSGMHRTPGVPGQEPPAAPEPIPLTCTAHVSRGEATERVTPAGVGVVGHGIDDSLQVFLLLQTGGVRLRGAWGKAGSVTAPPRQGEELGHCSRMG